MGDHDDTDGCPDLLVEPPETASKRPTIRRMPVIVVGADTPLGLSIVSALIEPDREVRAFVTDGDVAISLKGRGVKVALGDVSDPSHVGGACLNCFSAVLVTEAALDGRERAFAIDRRTVLEGWTEAVREADVTRVIWVDTIGDLPSTGIEQTAVVNPETIDDVAAEVVRLDDAARL
jgi:hypothetical protein